VRCRCPCSEANRTLFSYQTEVARSREQNHLRVADFHRSAILELCRVAGEVRIFPLLALDGRVSPYITGIVEDLSEEFEVSIEKVPYEFQRGGNQMMRVRVQNSNC
jgi:hypothetical protein